MNNIENILYTIIKNPTNDEERKILQMFLDELYCNELLYGRLSSVLDSVMSIISDKLDVYSDENERGAITARETDYLLSIPGMKESIIEGREEPIEKCNDKLQWEISESITTSKNKEIEALDPYGIANKLEWK